MADGYLTFDTRVDTKGFQTSVSKLGSTVTTAMKGILTGIAVGVAVVAVAVVAIGAAFMALYKQMLKMDGFKDNVKGLELAFANLKNAAISAVLPLFNALLPIVMKIVAWLTEAANAAGMFIAALTGADTYMVYVADSVGSAADSAGTLADETERAGEAAEGALASFDKLNVLQQASDSTSGSGSGSGSGSAGTGHWEEKPVSTLDWWAKFKKAWEDFWNWSWDANAWFKKAIIDPIINSKWWNWSWDANKWFLDHVWTPFITGAFWNWKWDANKWFLDNIWTPFITGTFWNWKFDANAWFKTAIINPILTSNVWQWKFDANKWFSNSLAAPIRNSSIWNWSWDANAWFVDKLLNPFLGGLQTFINGIIDFINQLPGVDIGRVNISPVSTGSNDWNGGGYGLASGGVIPPNAPFTAILGDNKTQKEIVAPEDMIRRIVREETAGQGAQRITIDFGNSSLGALIQTLNPLIKQENNRRGSSMAKASGA